MMTQVMTFKNDQRELALSYLIWEAAGDDEQKILVISPAYHLSKTMLKTLKGTLLCSRYGRADIDRTTVINNNTTIVAMPIGDGSKVRGYRPDKLVIIDVDTIPKDILQTLIPTTVRGQRANTVVIDEAVEKEHKKDE
jgi:hypothetical protein